MPKIRWQPGLWLPHRTGWPLPNPHPLVPQFSRAAFCGPLRCKILATPLRHSEWERTSCWFRLCHQRSTVCNYGICLSVRKKELKVAHQCWFQWWLVLVTGHLLEGRSQKWGSREGKTLQKLEEDQDVLSTSCRWQLDNGKLLKLVMYREINTINWRPGRPREELDQHHKTTFKGSRPVMAGRTTAQHCTDKEDWHQCLASPLCLWHGQPRTTEYWQKYFTQIRDGLATARPNHRIVSYRIVKGQGLVSPVGSRAQTSGQTITVVMVVITV